MRLEAQGLCASLRGAWRREDRRVGHAAASTALAGRLREGLFAALRRAAVQIQILIFQLVNELQVCSRFSCPCLLIVLAPLPRKSRGIRALR